MKKGRPLRAAPLLFLRKFRNYQNDTRTPKRTPHSELNSCGVN